MKQINITNYQKLDVSYNSTVQLSEEQYEKLLQDQEEGIDNLDQYLWEMGIDVQHGDQKIDYCEENEFE